MIFLVEFVIFVIIWAIITMAFKKMVIKWRYEYQVGFGGVAYLVASAIAEALILVLY